MTIPGPKLKPAVQSFHWYARPLAFLRECAESYGDPFRIELTRFGEHVCFSDPDVLKDIFTTHASSLDAGVGNAPLKALLGDYSLLTLDGEHHRRHRKLLMPVFHGKQVALYEDQMRELSRAAFATWPRDRPFEAYPKLLELTLAIVLETVFGFRDEMRKRDLKTLIGNLLHHSNVSLSFFERFEDAGDNKNPDATLEWMRQRSSRLDALLYQEIEQRRALPELMGHDVLSMMLRAVDDNGDALEAVEIHDELLTLLVAGHETTAAALAWTFIYVAKHEAVQQRCVEWIDKLDPTAAALARCAYLRAVCSEAMRVMPVIPVVSRGAQRDLVIGGHAIKKGTRVTPCIYLTHHRRDVWGDPEVFRPERFLEQTFSPYSFLPFGGGFRRCVGATFAQHQMAIVLGELLSQHTLTLPDGKVPRALRNALLMMPAGGAKLTLSQR